MLELWTLDTIFIFVMNPFGKEWTYLISVDVLLFLFLQTLLLTVTQYTFWVWEEKCGRILPSTITVELRTLFHWYGFVNDNHAILAHYLAKRIQHLGSLYHKLDEITIVCSVTIFNDIIRTCIYCACIQKVNIK